MSTKGKKFNLQFNTWDEIHWQSARQHLRKMQYQIYDASRLGNTRLVHILQKRLVKSISAKLLSVQQITTLNKRRKSCKVKPLLLITANQKLQLARSLHLDKRSTPITRRWIDKPGKNKDKLSFGITIIEDRAKQILVKLALEPQWEAVFEPSSYGFRPGRGCHDAIQGIFIAMNKQDPKWIFNADIRKSFDKINQEALLEKINTFPEMRRQIRAWLKSGLMEGYANIPKESITSTEEGILQGQVISPLLANIALHGLENEMKNFVCKINNSPYTGRHSSEIAKRKALTTIRYADDFVVISPSMEILSKSIAYIKVWLSAMGLTIHEEKSIVRDSREGFNFLGFRILLVRRKSNCKYKVKIYPSKASQISILEKIRLLINRNKAISSYQLIEWIRPMIIDWAKYYSCCECKVVFAKLSNLIFHQIKAWVFRRDPKHGKAVIKCKYFPSGKKYLFNGREYKDNWILVGKRKEKEGVINDNFLPHMKWIQRRKHVMVKGDASPFNKKDSLYWSMRIEKYSSFGKAVM